MMRRPSAQPILELVYGSTIVNLLSRENYGIYLDNWQPGIAHYKDGGVYSASPLSDGRRIKHRAFDNAIETFELVVKGSSHDNMIYYVRLLQIVVEAAANYWTGPSRTPVYIKAKSAYETEARYALIISGQVQLDTAPIGPVITQPNQEGLVNLTLSLERLHWWEDIPGEGADVDIGWYDTYDGRTLGNVNANGTFYPSADQPDVYVAGSIRETNLTDVYYYDDSAASFSTNLLDAALPHVLFPPVPATNDIHYVGIDTSLTNSGPFCNVIYDIGQVMSGTFALEWRYWNGAWTLLNPSDTTGSFQSAGVGSVSFRPPSDWTTTSVNGVTGYWIKCTIISGTPAQVAKQANKDIYSCTWPFIYLQEGQVPGDLRALARLYAEPVFGPVAVKRLYLGLRSVSRDGNITPFQAYLNASNEQNPSTLTVSVSGAAFTADTRASSGVLVRSTNASSAYNHYVSFTFTAPAIQSYYGTFRIFIRAMTDDVTNSKIRVRAIDGAGATVYEKTDIRFEDATLNLLDGGLITIPKHPLPSVRTPINPVLSATYVGDRHFIYVYMGNDDATGVIDVYDIILLPVDEWQAEIDSEYGQLSTVNQAAVIDSLGTFKSQAAYSFDVAQSEIDQGAILRSNGPFSLQPNTEQKLWIVSKLVEAGTNAYGISYLTSVQLTRQAQYLSMRGST